MAGLMGAVVCAAAGESFITVMEHETKGDFREQTINSLWHERRPAVGALGFEVVVGDWPRLLQRGSLDIHNFMNNREIFRIATYQDLGQVRLAQGRIKPKIEESSWCHRKYAFGAGRLTLKTVASRLTPALWFETGHSSLELFAGTKRGNRKANDLTQAVPGHMAFVENGKVIVRSTGEKVPLAGMSEPWALFFFGKGSYLTRTSIPNVLARLGPISSYLKSGYLQASDMPVLVVFQRKPKSLDASKDAVRVSFTDAGAGVVVLMPLYGSYHPPAEETARWTSSLPADVVKRCRTWARRAKALPVSAAESYRVAEDGRVTVRQQFRYLEMADEWESPAERVAPIPPVISLSRKYGFDVELSGTPAESDIVTHSGPYAVVAGADAIEYTVPSLSKYIRETLATPRAEDAISSALTQNLSDEVRRMIDAWPLKPARNIIGWMEPHFVNPGETVLAVAEALPYLDELTRERAATFVAKLIAKHDPLTSDGLPDAGKPREYAPSDLDERRTVRRNVRWEDRFNNVYGLWLLAHTTGDWGSLEARLGDLKKMATQAAVRSEWASCGYFRGPGEDRNNARAHRGEDRGGIWAVNGQFARWVALARIARHCEDSATEDLARYMLARTAVLRFAHGKLIRYSYDAGLQNIALKPDWMYRLSTSGGNGSGPGLLWTPHWAGADDDVRAVIEWDEFGPIVSQMLNQMWQPVMPHFQDTVPELGRFVGDHLRPETRRYVAAVEANAPAWHLTRRPAYLGKEMHLDSPRNSLGVFLAKCYVLGADGKEMTRYQDIPFLRVGDLYHLRRLTANLRCFGGLHWEELQP